MEFPLRLFARGYHWLLSSGCTIGMIGYISAVVIQVFSRTFLPTVPSWTEEAARYLFIYSVALGAGVVTLKDEYARVDIFTSRLSGTTRQIYEIAACVLLLFFDLYLASYSIPKFVFLKFRMVSTAMEIPMQFINFSVMLFAVLQAAAYIINIFFLAMGIDPKSVYEEARQ